MEGFIGKLWGSYVKGTSSAAVHYTAVDDFADFVSDAATPAVESFATLASSATAAAAATGTDFLTNLLGQTQIGSRGPYTKWYRIWERHTWRDFTQEYIIFTFISVVILIHLYGSRKNRTIAKKWLKETAPMLAEEYTVVGFGREERPVDALVLIDGISPALMKEKSASEFTSYATGRLNVAFVDITLNTFKRFNPVIILGEYLAALLIPSMYAPSENVLYTIYPFDGREKELLVAQGAEDTLSKQLNSKFDDFTFAIVRKDIMKRLKEERYDISLAPMKESPKLPIWAAVMSESAEITDLMLTPDLIAAVTEAGDQFEYLIISDQPIDKPEKVEETVPKKRIFLSVYLPGSSPDTSLAIQRYAVSKLPDMLTTAARFRPEVLRKIKTTRDEEKKLLTRVVDEEAREERSIKREREKKEKRDAALRNMTAEEQRKALEKEREKAQRKGGAKMKVRG